MAVALGHGVTILVTKIRIAASLLLALAVGDERAIFTII